MKSLPEIKDQIALEQYGKEWHMLTESQQNQEIDRVAIAYAEQFKIEVEPVENRKPMFFDSFGNTIYEDDVYYFVDSCMNIWEGICHHESGKKKTIKYFKHRHDAEACVKKIK